MRGGAGTFGVGLVHDGGNTVGAAAGNSSVERRRAVRAVAAMAVDADDCARLLDQLGLDPSEGVVVLPEVNP